MSDLFTKKPIPPLAHKIRPSSFEEVIGQSRATKQLVNYRFPVSIILYGPPGTGKSTLAGILCRKWNLPFVEYNAVSTGVVEIKKLLERAEREGTILLFLDEIHRFSASQQDSLLKGVETGHLILIGATTENPASRITRPLLSRCQILKIEPLSLEEQSSLLERGIQNIEYSININKDAKETLIRFSGGDGRKLLSNLEGLSFSFPENHTISKSDVEEYLESRVIEYDKSGESHYDVISAFIKSVRGSDPDAALYYLAVLLEGGEDPLFIMRRLIILASEDVGNASVNGLPLAVSGLHALDAIGMPEGRLILAHVTTFLASCPKSNASYKGIGAALAFVREHGTRIKIPNRLRNAPTFLHKKEGASKGYIYPHDFGGFKEQNYFPDEFADNPPKFYFPTGNGAELKLKEYLDKVWEKTPWKKGN
ncbi:replication-associated recombination protein A [Leptospira kirschneri]|uniref:replication-associated recombination protein A n=1 Tax=Leptospira kirschneri TaxID=29507 RepID=UPI00030C3022|nr:replication-associated recombination protein A [Leptospira kirschneri]